MSSPQGGQNFLDKNTILAIVIVTTVWIGWTYYQQQKYPELRAQKAETTETAMDTKDVAKSSVSKNGSGSPNGQATESGTPVALNSSSSEVLSDLPEETVSFDSKNWSFLLSSKGMGVRDIVLKDYKNRQHNAMMIGLENLNALPFSTNIVGRSTPLEFSLEKTDENQFTGRAQVGEMLITKSVVVDPENYTLTSKVWVENAPETFLGLTLALNKEMQAAGGKSFFLPSFERQELYVDYDGRNDRKMFDEKEDLVENYSRVKMASLGSQYFALAVLDNSEVMPDLKAQIVPQKKTATGTLVYSRANKSPKFDLSYVGFAGPKSMSLLESIDERMANIIDLGWFGAIGTYILRLMKWFYFIMGNWGVAIILLTVVVRLMVLPFNLMSYKSMKVMQRIQPEMKALREKYKDDKQQLNVEMVQLMREAKANPLGGCLPMLIQFPVFIALYQVLGQSIELYQAPFGLWISDLSLKDPYYVLPVLMGLTMFVQQKITPSTMDPAQAKVMLFLPVFFAFLMSGLPAGLTLYIFVSALFGVFQQMIFMRPEAASA